MTRTNNRAADALRPVELIPNVNKWAEGSCLIKWGDTHVVCTATIEEKVPTWLKGAGHGWVTAEYGMLPRSTANRMDREAKKGQQGRTQEIQRLIGRALRGCVDLRAIDGMTVKIDCDVIQADGGTRTASVTGGFIALYLALSKAMKQKKWEKLPVRDFVAAVSCGIVDKEPVLDLDYQEDSHAMTDSNFVMNAHGGIIEVQGTAERGTFSPEEYTKLLALAQKGIGELIQKQRAVLMTGTGNE
ncbi:MAG: ribonuclease PH [Alphaproteobacteria bacterium]|nr:ribonuclease PH [Alphaproteobacteria bacterium]